MNPPGEAYLRWYYDSLVWKHLSYRGVRILKNVIDLWNYQEIFQEHAIEWVLETGTRHGGSALYFADLLAARQAAGLVISIDVEHESLQIQIPRDASSRLRLLKGDSGSPAMVDLVDTLVPRKRAPMFVILDSDHRQDHVARELGVYVPWMQAGDYLVVEDTCVNGHPVRPEYGPGPMEAVAAFLAARPGLLRPDLAREEKFGCTFAPGGYFVRI